MSQSSPRSSEIMDVPLKSPPDRQAYRDGMARLAAAVNIITSDGPAGRCGFTASAVCSVTDTPPILLVCVNRSAQSSPLIKVNGVLCVNTVDPRHEALSMCFAGATGVRDMDTRFSGASWRTLITGSPVLDGAAAAFDCKVVERIEMGAHEVLFCEVLGVVHEPTAEGLVHLDRAFHRLPARPAGAVKPQERQ